MRKGSIAVAGLFAATATTGVWVDAARAEGAVPLGVEFIANVATPTHLTHAPGDFDRLFVPEQVGRIVVINDGAVLQTPFLDIQALVRSATGAPVPLILAFHPAYPPYAPFHA